MKLIPALTFTTHLGTPLKQLPLLGVAFLARVDFNVNVAYVGLDRSKESFLFLLLAGVLPLLFNATLQGNTPLGNPPSHSRSLLVSLHKHCTFWSHYFDIASLNSRTLIQSPLQLINPRSPRLHLKPPRPPRTLAAIRSPDSVCLAPASRLLTERV